MVVLVCVPIGTKYSHLYNLVSNWVYVPIQICLKSP